MTKNSGEAYIENLARQRSTRRSRILNQKSATRVENQVTKKKKQERNLGKPVSKFETRQVFEESIVLI